MLGGWISITAKVSRREKNMRGENLPDRFEDWMYKNCTMKKQTIYNYKNLYKLMRIAPKLMNCRVNMTYFAQNHEILISYFNEENEEQPRKHSVSWYFEACNSYFTEQTITSWSINICRFLKAMVWLDYYGLKRRSSLAWDSIRVYENHIKMYKIV